MSEREKKRREKAHFEIEDPYLYAFNMLVRHARTILPNLENFVLLTESEHAICGLVVGYLGSGENQITVPVGAIAPDGSAWTTLSVVPTMVLGNPLNTRGKIKRRVLGK